MSWRVFAIASLTVLTAAPRRAETPPKPLASWAALRVKVLTGQQPCGDRGFGSSDSNFGSNTLSRIDPRTNKIVATGAGASPCGLAVGHD
jgi:hypothetical protein